MQYEEILHRVPAVRTLKVSGLATSVTETRLRRCHSWSLSVQKWQTCKLTADLSTWIRAHAALIGDVGGCIITTIGNIL